MWEVEGVLFCRCFKGYRVAFMGLLLSFHRELYFFFSVSGLHSTYVGYMLFLQHLYIEVRERILEREFLYREKRGEEKE